MMVAYYDAASSQVHLYFAGNMRRAVDFRMVSARGGSAQFLSVAGHGLPAYRLTCKVPSANVLLITLEEAVPDRENAFSTVARWSFHRLFLVRPAGAAAGF